MNPINTVTRSALQGKRVNSGAKRGVLVDRVARAGGRETRGVANARGNGPQMYGHGMEDGCATHPPSLQTWRPTSGRASQRRVLPDLEGRIKILEVGIK